MNTLTAPRCTLRLTALAGARLGRRLAALTAVLASLAAFALVLIGGTTSADAATHTPALRHARTHYEASIAVAVQRALNAERRAHHLAPLTMSSKLKHSARVHNLRMAQANTLSHQLPHEAFFANRITKAGYHWTYAGENIAWNSRISTAAVLQLETIMYNERPPMNDHRQNILSRNYRNVGIDVFIDRIHHKVWLTTDFGHR
ncbi:CAP domain-containing protein [uncultured Jatrophihabitans sp.]|uniref:CAP domain-containing protein n=1 Tax=uncultured Jatrophihabitans sp. TaxID=1610747 RepID=UPI0035CA5659